jgi:hypothetical protein
MQRAASFIVIVLGIVGLDQRAAYAEAATTVGPTIGIRSVDGKRFEFGGEAAQWIWKPSVPGMVGIDVGGSNRALWIELELATQLQPTEVLAGIAGGVGRSFSGDYNPQFTVWTTHLKFPFVPYARLTGLGESHRIWQGGVMFKLPIFYRL